MHRMRRLVLLPLAAALLLVVAALAGVARPEAAHGDSTQPTGAAPSDTVTTLGHGVITAVPDQATVSAGVRSDAVTAVAALADNAKTMNAVIDALKQAGGTELQTQQVSLYPQTDQQGKVTGYTAQNTVSAKAKIAGAGALVDAAVGAGANTVDGPSLDVSDRDGLYRQALQKAVENARAKAQALAEAGGFGVGPVSIVVEQSTAVQPVFAGPTVLGKAADASTPVEPGTQDVTADVSVVFRIR
jgi:uncharacterized protein YggE